MKLAEIFQTGPPVTRQLLLSLLTVTVTGSESNQKIETSFKSKCITTAMSSLKKFLFTHKCDLFLTLTF